MRHFAPLIFTTFLASTAIAQDNPNTILVMDGSGSMWGQIDGVAKITIAQDVVSSLMQTIPTDQNIGLTVYGHRERGNCTDIETMVAPGPNTRDAIRNAVNGIKPLGKTPMTDSIIAAAEALRYTEDSATVILVSDGVETCNPDPCAAMRLLEEAGIDFTAHVVGFDVGSDAAALQQMQCIADETGGQFLTADNAEELGQALQTVAAEPEPITVPMTFTAVIGDDRRIIESLVLWDINSDTGLVGDNLDGNPLRMDIVAGSYVATAYSLALEESVNVDFVVGSTNDTMVQAVFTEQLPTASLMAPDTASAGSTITVTISDGPLNRYDQIVILRPDANPSRPTRVNKGSVNGATEVAVNVPGEVGDYIIHYILHDGSESIAQRPLTVTPSNVEITAPDEARAGTVIPVSWTNGPNVAYDQIRVTPVGETTRRNADPYLRADIDLTTGDLALPSTSGAYVLRYVSAEDEGILAERPITILETDVVITAPDEAVAGTTIDVSWTNGPGAPYDQLRLIEVGATPTRLGIYIRASGDVDAGQIALPAAPGNYLLQYVSAEDDGVLVERPITLTESDAQLVLPTTAPLGSLVTVGWDGPDSARDFIAVGETGATDYINYTYTSKGNPLTLLMPPKVGDYEVRYHLREGNTVIASQTITVTDAPVTLEAPEDAALGSLVAVNWTGPDYERDFIAVGAVGSDDYINYTYTTEGDGLKLLMPVAAGDYEIRYYLSQEKTILAAVPITITEAGVTINAATDAPAGTTIPVTWDGPDFERDFISVAKIGDQGYVNYTYTADGNPAQLELPAAPGDYEIRYQLRQDNKVMATIPITVTPLKVTLDAAANANIGETIPVTWDGPDYPRDFIAVSEAGDAGYINYTYTTDGHPTALEMPATPGEYEIRYFMRQDNTVVARQTVTVAAVKGQIAAPATIALDETLMVGWDGPNYQRDFIAISKVGDATGYETYTYTGDGNPIAVRLPDAAGDYEIRYVMRQGNTIIARAPLTITN